jgi:DNA-binding response OmpR family regulator
MQVADLVFDLEKVTLSRADTPIKLNAVRLKILKLLMENTHRVVSRSEIETHIWGDDLTESDALRTHLSAIRQAIDKPFENKLLHTVHSVGYRLYDEKTV